MLARTSSKPEPVAADVAMIRTPSPTTRATSPRKRSTSAEPTRSDLVNTTTGSAPQSFTSTSERAIRSIIGASERSAPSGCTMKMVSTFAARTWRSPRFFPRQRANEVRRGSTHSMTPMSWPSGTRTATASPTAGSRRSSSPCVFAKVTACSARNVTLLGPHRGRPLIPGAPRSPCKDSSAETGSEAAASSTYERNAVRWRSSDLRSANDGTSFGCPGTAGRRQARRRRAPRRPRGGDAPSASSCPLPWPFPCGPLY